MTSIVSLKIGLQGRAPFPIEAYLENSAVVEELNILARGVFETDQQDVSSRDGPIAIQFFREFDAGEAVVNKGRSYKIEDVDAYFRGKELDVIPSPSEISLTVRNSFKSVLLQFRGTNFSHEVTLDHELISAATASYNRKLAQCASGIARYTQKLIGCPGEDERSSYINMIAYYDQERRNNHNTGSESVGCAFIYQGAVLLAKPHTSEPPSDYFGRHKIGKVLAFTLNLAVSNRIFNLISFLSSDPHDAALAMGGKIRANTRPTRLRHIIAHARLDAGSQ